ncbi:hypothetical protein YB2330_003173 [Saitoella coloradoensis]
MAKLSTLLFGLALGVAGVIASPARAHGINHQDAAVPIPDFLPSENAEASRNAIFEASTHLGGALIDSLRELEGVFEKAVEGFEPMSIKAPKKSIKKVEHGWDTVKLQALGDDYSLRVKSPKDLGVDDVKQYAGYLDVSDEKHFFYWFFESRNDPKKDPIVLWLNGGPGCSSLTGLFMELGPASVKGDKVKRNEFSWNNNASVIFLDQPVNVGYSYGDESVSNTVAAGQDVYALLTLFFKQFPEYADLPFHIAGESYAGHYIPVFAKEILAHSNRESHDFHVSTTESALASVPKINLESVLIGNGLTDPLTQYEFYPDMACNNSYGPVLDEMQCEGMRQNWPRCKSLIESCYESGSRWSCVPAAIYCNNVMMGPYQKTGKNVYDVRDECVDKENLCYPILGDISRYLNRDDVKSALGVEVEKYDSCNFDINRNFLFAGDWMQPFHRDVPVVLDKGVDVLIYAGDADFICNWIGNEAWTEALEWPGQKSFNAAKKHKFTMRESGEHVGDVKSNGNFTFMRVFGAGHMVPYDQPESSLEMFNAWIGGERFQK